MRGRGPARVSWIVFAADGDEPSAAAAVVTGLDALPALTAPGETDGGGTADLLDDAGAFGAATAEDGALDEEAAAGGVAAGADVPVVGEALAADERAGGAGGVDSQSDMAEGEVADAGAPDDGCWAFDTVFAAAGAAAGASVDFFAADESADGFWPADTPAATIARTMQNLRTIAPPRNAIYQPPAPVVPLMRRISASARW